VDARARSRIGGSQSDPPFFEWPPCGHSQGPALPAVGRGRRPRPLRELAAGARAFSGGRTGDPRRYVEHHVRVSRARRRRPALRRRRQRGGGYRSEDAPAARAHGRGAAARLGLTPGRPALPTTRARAEAHGAYRRRSRAFVARTRVRRAGAAFALLCRCTPRGVEGEKGIGGDGTSHQCVRVRRCGRQVVGASARASLPRAHRRSPTARRVDHERARHRRRRARDRGGPARGGGVADAGLGRLSADSVIRRRRGRRPRTRWRCGSHRHRR
jgi:hypothetical protein